MASKNILLKNLTIMTMDIKDTILKDYDILIENNLIMRIGKNLTEKNADIYDYSGKIALPGFIQTHIHLCQTLFRSQADDLFLLDWLKKRIWPYEANHTEESLYWSSLLGISELIRCGTTTIVDMATNNHTESVFKAIEESGIRAFTGKMLMDLSEDAPNELLSEPEKGIIESEELFNKWHNKCNERIKYILNPRFVVSCSDELLNLCKKFADKNNLFIHTHASENKDEVEFIKNFRGMRNIKYLDKIGLLSDNLLLAHCIWLDDEEFELIKNTDTKVLHCPSSNLKLGSGIADIPKMLENGISVSLGADGAPCNNNLDIFTEMRLAALLQKHRYNPTVMNAKKILRMATIDGARALKIDNEVGSIEIGKKADIVILDLNKIENQPLDLTNLASTIVYSASKYNVFSTMVDGKFLFFENKPILNESEIISNANKQWQIIKERIS